MSKCPLFRPLMFSLIVITIASLICLTTSKIIDTMQTIVPKSSSEFVDYHLPADIIATQYSVGTYVLHDGKIEKMMWSDIPATTVSYDSPFIYEPSYIDSVYFRAS